MIVNTLPKVEIPRITVHEYVLSCMQYYGDKIALIDNTVKVSLTYKEIIERTKLLATSLYRRGVRKGDIVGIISETTCHYTPIVLAVFACGAIPSPCNSLYTGDELKHQFIHSEAKFLFCSKTAMTNVNEIKDSLTCLEETFCIQAYDGIVCMDQLLSEGNFREYPINVSINTKEDVCILPYSSGTTGLPKGVMLTHENLLSIIVIFRCSGILVQSDRLYGVIPSFHIYGFAMQLISLSHGCTSVSDARFNFQVMLRVIQEQKITTLFLVPPLMVLLAKSLEVGNFDTSSVIKIFCGAAPLAPSLAMEVQAKLKNAHVVQGWGLTECAPISMSAFLSSPFDSVGTIALNTEVKVIDPDTGFEVKSGEDGEFCARGPQVMKGYFKNATATRKTIDSEGWLHTGDIGHVDNHGNFYIVDRLKELIKYKGFQVAPAELEAILLRHPDVDDAAVIGVPDQEAGELPKAFVVRKSSSLTEEDIQKFVLGKVSKYKELKGGVTFMEAIPKSASGKILRRHLRKLPVAGTAKL